MDLFRLAESVMANDNQLLSKEDYDKLISGLYARVQVLEDDLDHLQELGKIHGFQRETKSTKA